MAYWQEYFSCPPQTLNVLVDAFLFLCVCLCLCLSVSVSVSASVSVCRMKYASKTHVGAVEMHHSSPETAAIYQMAKHAEEEAAAARKKIEEALQAQVPTQY